MNRPAGDAPLCPDCSTSMIWENKRPRSKKQEWRWRCGRCRYLQASHKLTAGQWSLMVKAQDGRCAICQTETTLVVDHDHRCCRPGKSCPECRRGLLCNTCNRFLGLAGDDPQRLLAAFLYLATRTRD